MIIIEGPDNSGKTTLAKFLAKEIGREYYHAGGPPKSTPEIIGRVHFSFDNKDKYIFDRSPLISEQVYGVMRGQLYLNFEENEDLYSRFRELGPIIIYCRPPNDTILDMSTHEAKPHDTVEHVKQVTDKAVQMIALYDDAIEHPVMPKQVIYYDYTKDDKEELARQLLLILGLEEARKGPEQKMVEGPLKLDLYRLFSYHRPTEKSKELHEKIRAGTLNYAELLYHCLPSSPEMAIAIGKLQEVQFWANAAIAREKGERDNGPKT